MSVKETDYEERVFHELSLFEGKERTIQDIARRTNLKEGTVRAIVSRFEDMGFVRRGWVAPEAYFYAPSKIGKQLRKFRALQSKAALIQRLREKEVRAHLEYVQERNRESE